MKLSLVVCLTERNEMTTRTMGRQQSDKHVNIKEKKTYKFEEWAGQLIPFSELPAVPFVPSRRDGGRVAEVAAFSCIVVVVGFLTSCRNGEHLDSQNH